jgi:hypothetical protein
MSIILNKLISIVQSNQYKKLTYYTTIKHLIKIALLIQNLKVNLKTTNFSSFLTSLKYFHKFVNEYNFLISLI